MKKVGFTTTIPVEAVFAAGLCPVDLNNIFITSTSPSKLVEQAESDGFPRNTCAWIKGIYSAILDHEDIDTIISVVEGDCSNTRALSEVLNMKGIKTIPFSYPSSRDYHYLKDEMEKLCTSFNISFEDLLAIKNELDLVRKSLVKLDELTYIYNKATGFENYIWQVSASDFEGDYQSFHQRLLTKCGEIEQRPQMRQKLRLGYIGVPPIHGDLYDFVETLDARVVYNEVQRQFALPHSIQCEDIVEVYRNYTYPYYLDARLQDIKEQIKVRQLDGIIHYTQAFCFRAIEDMVIKNELDIPVLTMEGDRPTALDARTKLRIESFVEMIG